MREMKLLIFLENKFFRIKIMHFNAFKIKEEESEEESGENKLEKIKDDYKKFVKYIEDKSKGID